MPALYGETGENPVRVRRRMVHRRLYSNPKAAFGEQVIGFTEKTEYIRTEVAISL